MAHTSDGWPQDIMLPGPTDHLIALGAFALWYNEFEMLLYSFLRSYFPGKDDGTAIMYASMSNRGRVDVIRSMARTETDASVLDAVEHAMKCFGVCAENRNLIVHALPTRGGNRGDVLTLLKRSTNDPLRLKYYDFKVEDVRQAAISTARAARFSIELIAWVRPRSSKGPPQPLPEKPPLPRKLSLSQRREDPPSDLSPPPPSRG
jgi:hypothetical protein